MMFLLENTYHGLFDLDFFSTLTGPIAKTGFSPSGAAFLPLGRRGPCKGMPLWRGVNAVPRALWGIVVQTLWFLVLRVMASARRIHMNSGCILPTNLPHSYSPWTDTKCFSKTLDLPIGDKLKMQYTFLLPVIIFSHTQDRTFLSVWLTYLAQSNNF